MPRSSVASDAFTYSDGRLSSVSNNNWADVNGGVSYASVASNKVRATFGTMAPTRWNGTGTFAADQYVKATISGLNSSTGNCGVLARVSADTGANRDYYYAVVDCQANYSNIKTVVGKFVDGTETVFESVLSDGWVDGDTIALECEGTTLRVYRNDVLLRSYTDSSIAGSSSHKGGLTIGDSTNSMRIDDWEAGVLTAAIRRISIHLTDRNGTDAASLSALKLFVWDFSNPSLIATTLPAEYSATATTSSGGVLTHNLTTATTIAGGTVLVMVTNSDGTTTQSPPEKAFFGPVVVTEA